mgnify:CR=1 FL=1
MTYPINIFINTSNEDTLIRAGFKKMNSGWKYETKTYDDYTIIFDTHNDTKLDITVYDEIFCIPYDWVKKLKKNPENPIAKKINNEIITIINSFIAEGIVHE